MNSITYIVCNVCNCAALTTMDFRPHEAPFFWRLLLQIWPDRFQIFAHFISAQAPISVNMVC